MFTTNSVHLPGGRYGVEVRVDCSPWVTKSILSVFVVGATVVFVAHGGRVLVLRLAKQAWEKMPVSAAQMGAKQALCCVTDPILAKLEMDAAAGRIDAKTGMSYINKALQTVNHAVAWYSVLQPPSITSLPSYIRFKMGERVDFTVTRPFESLACSTGSGIGLMVGGKVSAMTAVKAVIGKSVVGKCAILVTGTVTGMTVGFGVLYFAVKVYERTRGAPAGSSGSGGSGTSMVDLVPQIVKLSAPSDVFLNNLILTALAKG